MPSDVLKGKRCVVPAKLSNSIYVEKGSERPLPFSLILAGILYRDERAGYLLKIIFVLSYKDELRVYAKKGTIVTFLALPISKVISLLAYI